MNKGPGPRTRWARRTQGTSQSLREPSAFCLLGCTAARSSAAQRSAAQRDGHRDATLLQAVPVRPNFAPEMASASAVGIGRRLFSGPQVIRPNLPLRPAPI